MSPSAPSTLSIRMNVTSRLLVSSYSGIIFSLIIVVIIFIIYVCIYNRITLSQVV